MGRIGTFFPHGMLDGAIKKATGLDVVEQMLRKWEYYAHRGQTLSEREVLQKLISILYIKLLFLLLGIFLRKSLGGVVKDMA